MGKKTLESYPYEMIILNLNEFMEKYILKDNTMNESDLKIVYNYSIFPGGSKTILDKGFVKINNSSLGGTHWTCFYEKENKSF